MTSVVRSAAEGKNIDSQIAEEMYFGRRYGDADPTLVPFEDRENTELQWVETVGGDTLVGCGVMCR